MNESLCILYVDDYPLDRQLVRDILEKEHGGFQVTEAASRQEFEARLAEKDYDLVLSDFNILGFEGLEVIDAVRAKDPHVPVVIVTGTGSEEIAVEAMKRGAADYVIKTPSHIWRLPRTIQAAIERRHLEEKRKRAEEALRDNKERLQTILGSVQAGIVTIDAETHQIVDANPAAIEMIGAPREQVIGSVCHNYICPAQRGYCPITDLGQDVDRAERELLKANGEAVPILKTVVPIMLDGREHLLESFVDITERVQAEDLIRTQHDLSLALGAALGLEETLRLCVETVIRVAKLDYAGVCLVDQTSGDIDLAFSKGLHPDLAKSISHLDADSTIAHLIMAGKPVYTRLQELDVPISEPLRREGLRAVAIIPVHHEGRVIACLNAASRTLDEIPISARNALETIAAQIGSVIARTQAEEALRESEEKYRNLLENSIEGIGISKGNRIVLANKTLLDIFGYETLEEFVKTPLLEHVAPESRSMIRKRLKKREKGEHLSPRYEYEIIRKDGEIRDLEISTSEILIRNEKYVQSTFRDITERKRAEKQIKASLQEKEVLLKEIHHRVKNNLQVVSSLLKLQADYAGDEQLAEMLQESRNRVKSMALVHERLYRSPDLARVDFAEYIRDLAAQLFSSYRAHGRGITLKIEIADVALGVDTAVPCGLIVNELLSNALKHAFPPPLSSLPIGGKGRGHESFPPLGGTEGGHEIRIGLCSDQDKFTLTVRDNGVGFPPDLDFRNTESLGLQLVVMLVKQLDGRIELDRGDGTTFKIKFAE